MAKQPKEDPNPLLSYILNTPIKYGIEGTRMDIPTYRDPSDDFDTYEGARVDPLGGVNFEAEPDWLAKRDAEQSLYDAWGNGLIKAVGKAGTTAIEGVGALATLPFGLIKGVSSGDWSGFYDNALGDMMDGINESLADAFPNYQSRRDSTFDADFWADQFLGGAGYMAGAILGGEGIGLIGKAVGGGLKATSLLQLGKGTKIKDIVGSGSKLAQFGAKLKDPTKQLAYSLATATSEAAVEARDVKNVLYDDLFARRDAGDLALQGKTDAELMDMSKAAGNAAFAFNLPVIAASNFLTFGKALTSKYGAARKSFGNVVGDIGETAVKKQSAILSGLGRFGEGAISEGSQELAQLGISEGSKKYYLGQYSSSADHFNSLWGSVIDETVRNFGTKEGFESMFLGAILGGPTSLLVGQKQRAQEKKNTAAYSELLNNPMLQSLVSNLSRRGDNITQVANASAQQDGAIVAGDKFGFKNSEYDVLKGLTKQAVELGGADTFVDKLEALKESDLGEFNKKFSNPEGEFATVEERNKSIDDAIQTVKSVAKAYDNIIVSRPELNPLVAEKTPELTQAKRHIFDAVFDAVTNFEDIDKRENDIASKILGLTAGQKITNIGIIPSEVGPILNQYIENTPGVDFDTFRKSDAYKENFQSKIDDFKKVNPAKASEVQTLVDDLIKLSLRREEMIKQYNEAIEQPEKIQKEAEAAAQKLQEKRDRLKAEADAQAAEALKTATEATPQPTVNTPQPAQTPEQMLGGTTEDGLQMSASENESELEKVAIEIATLQEDLKSYEPGSDMYSLYEAALQEAEEKQKALISKKKETEEANKKKEGTAEKQAVATKTISSEDKEPVDGNTFTKLMSPKTEAAQKIIQTTPVQELIKGIKVIIKEYSNYRITSKYLLEGSPIVINGRRVDSYTVDKNIDGSIGRIDVKFADTSTLDYTTAEAQKDLNKTYIVSKEGGIYEVGTETPVLVQKATQRENVSYVGRPISITFTYNGVELGYLPNADKFRTKDGRGWNDLNTDEKLNLFKARKGTLTLQDIQALNIQQQELAKIQQQLEKQPFGEYSLQDFPFLSITPSMGEFDIASKDTEPLLTTKMPIARSGGNPLIYDQNKGTFVYSNDTPTALDAVKTIPEGIQQKPGEKNKVGNRYLVLLENGNWAVLEHKELTLAEFETVFKELLDLQKRIKEGEKVDNDTLNEINDKVQQAYYVAQGEPTKDYLVARLSTKGTFTIRNINYTTGKESGKPIKSGIQKIETVYNTLSKEGTIKGNEESLRLKVGFKNSGLKVNYNNAIPEAAQPKEAVTSVEIEDKIAELRAAEEEEVKKIIPNIDDYKVDGVINKDKVLEGIEKRKKERINPISQTNENGYFESSGVYKKDKITGEEYYDPDTKNGTYSVDFSENEEESDFINANSVQELKEQIEAKYKAETDAYNEIYDRYDKLITEAAKSTSTEVSTEAPVTEQPTSVRERRKNKSDEINNDINAEGPFKVSELPAETKIKFEEALAYLRSILPFEVGDIDAIADRLTNNGITFGAFIDNVIYLNKAAEAGTEYHEAFHGVMSLFSTEERAKYLEVAKKEHKITDKARAEFVLQRPVYQNLSKEALDKVMLEEYLADKFMAWKQGKKEPNSFFAKMFDKIKKFFDSIKDYFGGNLDSLFHRIDSGKYKHRTIGGNKLPMFMALPYNTEKIKGTDEKIIKKLNSTEESDLINTIRVEVGELITESLASKDVYTIKQAFDKVLEMRDNLYLDKADELSEEEGDEYYQKNSGLFKITGVKEAVFEKVKSQIQFLLSVDEEIAERILSKEEEEDLRNYEASALQNTGISSMTQYVRILIATAHINAVDKYGTPYKKGINPSTIYNSISRTLLNTAPENFMRKLEIFSEYNPEVKIFTDYLKDKLNWNNETNNPGLNNDGELKNEHIWNAFKKAFHKFKVESMMTRLSSNGETKVSSSNAKDVDTQQIERWQIGYRNFIEKNFTKLNIADFIYFNATSPITDEQLEEESKKAKATLDSIGIKLSPLYLQYSLLVTKKERTDKQQELMDLYENFYGLNGSDGKFLKELITDFINTGLNPFTKGDEGMMARLKALAMENASFDETAGSSTFQNAEGELVGDTSLGSFFLKRVAQLQKPEARAEDLEEFTRFYANQEDEWMIPLHHLATLDNPLYEHAETFDKKFVFTNIDGIRATEYDEQGNEINKQEGTVFKNMVPLEKLLTFMSLYSTTKVKTTKEGKKINYAYYYPQVIEAASTGYAILLPVKPYYDKGYKPAFYQALLSFVKNEHARIKYVQENKDLPSIRNFNVGEKNGLKFFENYWISPELSEKLIALNSVDEMSVELKKELKDNIDQFVQQDYLLTVDTLVREGAIIEVEGEFYTRLLPEAFRTDKKITKDEKTYQKVNTEKIRSMQANYLINGQAFNTLLHGDLAYKIKSPEDHVKRLKGAHGALTSLYGRQIKFKVIPDIKKEKRKIVVDGLPKFVEVTEAERAKAREKIIADNPNLSEKEIAKKVKEKLELDEHNLADAQAYTTLDFQIARLKELGKTSPAIVKILEKVRNGVEITRKELELLEGADSLLNPKKDLAYALNANLKMSVLTLTRELVSYKSKGEWLAIPGREREHKILNDMVKNTIDLVAHESASKGTTIIDEVRTLNGEYYGEQVLTKGVKQKITDGTQQLALIWSELPQELESLVEKLDEAEQNRVIQSTEFALSLLKEKDETTLKKVLPNWYNSLVSTGASPQLLEIFKPNAAGEPTLNPNISISVAKFTAMYLAHWSNHALKQKVAGSKFTLVTPFDVMVDKDDNVVRVDQFKSGAKYTKSRPLAYNKRGKLNGREIVYSECIVSSYYKELYNLKEGDEIPEDLAYMMGYRIPTEDKASMGVLKVVDFLPAIYGNAIMIPEELQYLSGADFDIDSLFVQKYDIYEKDGKFYKYGTALNNSTLDKEVKFKIPMNFEDGTGGRIMRPEFKGKSTLELIKEGNRTATSRDRSKSYNQQDIKVGDIIEFYAATGKSKGQKAKVIVTKAPYKLTEITAEEWSKLEGWGKERFLELKNSYEQFQFELVTENLEGQFEEFINWAKKETDVESYQKSLLEANEEYQDLLKQEKELQKLIEARNENIAELDEKLREANDFIPLSLYEESEKEITRSWVLPAKSKEIAEQKSLIEQAKEIQQRKQEIKANKLASALRYYELPASKTAWAAAVKEGKYPDGKFKAVLNNDLLTYKLEMLGNEKVQNTLASEKTSNEPLLKLQETLAMQFPATFDSGKQSLGFFSFNDLAVAMANNDAGSDGIGPAAVFNVLYQYLAKQGVGIKDAQRFAIKEGFTVRKYYQFKGFSFKKDGVYRNAENKRIVKTISAIISAMTDNAKEPIAAKLNLNLETLGPVLVMLGTGVKLSTAIKIANSPKVKQLSQEILQSKSNFSDVSAYSIVQNAKAEVADVDFTQETTVLDEELLDLLLKDGEDIGTTSDIALKLYLNAREISEDILKGRDILSLRKGVPATFGEVDKIITSLNKLRDGKTPATLGLSRLLDVKPIEALTKALEDLNSVAQQLFTMQHPYIKETFNAVKQEVKRSESKDVSNKIYSDLSSFMSLSIFRKYLEDYVPSKKNEVKFIETFKEVFTEDVLFEKTLLEEVEDLKKNAKKYNLQNNRFLKYLSTEPRLIKRTVDKIEGNTRQLRDSDYQLELINGFDDLYANPLTRKTAVKLFAYILLKDGARYRNASFQSEIPSYMFKIYSNALDAFRSNPSMVDVVKLGNEFIKLYSLNLDNRKSLYKISKSNPLLGKGKKDGSFKEEAGQVAISRIENSVFPEIAAAYNFEYNSKDDVYKPVPFLMVGNNLKVISEINGKVVTNLSDLREGDNFVYKAAKDVFGIYSLTPSKRGISGYSFPLEKAIDLFGAKVTEAKEEEEAESSAGISLEEFLQANNYSDFKEPAPAERIVTEAEYKEIKAAEPVTPPTVKAAPKVTSVSEQLKEWGVTFIEGMDPSGLFPMTKVEFHKDTEQRVKDIVNRNLDSGILSQSAILADILKAGKTETLKKAIEC
jgi:hypothetical protein